MKPFEILDPTGLSVDEADSRSEALDRARQHLLDHPEIEGGMRVLRRDSQTGWCLSREHATSLDVEFIEDG